MCIYMYIHCTYICIWTYIYTNTFNYICTYIYIHRSYVYTYMRIWNLWLQRTRQNYTEIWTICIWKQEFENKFYVSFWTWIKSACAEDIYIYAYIHIFIHIHIHIYIHIYILYTYIIYIYTYTYTYIYIYMYYIHVSILTWIKSACAENDT